jgi:signal transduction histidine kinase
MTTQIPAGTDSEMAALCRELDWSSTPLGARDGWPAALRITADTLLGSPFPTVLLWGDDLTQLYNDAYRIVLGHRHPEALGQSTQRCWPDVWHLNAPVYEQVRAGGSVLVEDAPFPVQRDGAATDAWFTLGYSPVRDDDGVVHGVLVTMFETTTQVLAQRAAERSSRAKGDFLTVMSHELRTPLNAIGGYAELLALGVRGAITPEQRDDLTRIQESQRHLLEIINGVLSYAKVEAGVLHYAVEDVVMDELLARCEALVATEVRERGLELRYADCSTGLAARADGAKVQQIVMNLLSNAIKFTPRGGRVTLSCAAEEDKRLVVRVSDTGGGINATDLECIFHPFVQVDSRITRSHEGTGLGLAIGREMARGMGGDLSVASVPGEGSTFTLTLACGRGVAQRDMPGKRTGDSG